MYICEIALSFILRGFRVNLANDTVSKLWNMTEGTLEVGASEF